MNSNIAVIIALVFTVVLVITVSYSIDNRLTELENKI